MAKPFAVRALRPLLVLAAVAALVVVVARTGVADVASDEDRLRATVEDAGPVGPVLFLGLMVLLVPLNVPGVVFVIPSTVLFGPVGGILLSFTGGFLASVVGVVGARHLARDAFERRMPDRIRRIEQRLSARGFWGVVALRSCTFLFQPADWVCGLSSMPMRTVLGGTFVGLVPPTLVLCLGGAELLDQIL